MELRRYVGRVLPPVLFVLLLPIALAGPTVMNRDRADNSLAFTYDADSAQITKAVSTKPPITKGDRVDFLTVVDESSPPGRVVGRITLRLIGKRPVTYNGTFTYTVKDASGNVAFKATRDRRFTLRPKAGRRFASLRFTFDLPSGDYAVAARFVAN
ncbi:MAG: hypothetical protein ACRDKT_09720 [Actinomycetota bacterium]